MSNSPSPDLPLLDFPSPENQAHIKKLIKNKDNNKKTKTKKLTTTIFYKKHKNITKNS